jgi:FAD-NAD(P)-binding
MTTMMEPRLDVAIVGMGPRGLSVLERLITRLTTTAQPDRQARVFLVDPGEMGAGRIWRTDQPQALLMNTAAVEVSLFSGGPDDGPWRAGAGPSLYEWLRARADVMGEEPPSPNTYAPRRVYGQYLRAVYHSIVANLPARVALTPIRGRAHSLRREPGGRYSLAITGQGEITADKVVLTTGHPRVHSSDQDLTLLDFASRHRGTRYLRGDSAADMELTGISARDDVAILGMGLTFYDVVSLLTIERGGHYEEKPGGSLRYVPSGYEPHLVAGSRSGLPLRARGRNQKDADFRYQPRIFTTESLGELRATARRESGHAQLGFRRHVLPLVLRELDYVYYSTAVRRRQGAEAADAFGERYVRASADPLAVDTLLAEFDLAGLPRIDLDALARPFSGERYADPGAFRRRLLKELREDAAAAAEGNVDGPLKAALDALRDTRGVMRAAVEFSGLHPDSHRDEFLGWFNPVNTMLSSGPPAARVEQTIALIEAGVLTVVGPGVQVSTDEETGRFTLASPSVGGSQVVARILIDARIPQPSVFADASPFIRQLIMDGLASAHVNTNDRDGSRFTTGALAVTESPFHVIDASGRPCRDVYALGIPTEELRWFTQIGNGRPGPLTSFHADADAIVQHLLASRRPQARHRPVAQGARLTVVTSQ